MSDPRETRRQQRSTRGSLTADLAARIARARGDDAVEAEGRARVGDMTGAGRAFRLASEFVAAIIVGAAIGYGLDLLFKTTPWLLIILLLLGFAAGVRNVVRAAAEMNAAAAVPPDTPPMRDDEDD